MVEMNVFNDILDLVFVLQIGVEPLFVLFLDCPEDIMVARVLGRNEVLTI